MYLGGWTLFIVIFVIGFIYVKLGEKNKDLEARLDQLSNKVIELEDKLQKIDEPDEEELIEKETKNWIDLKSHLDKIVKRKKISKEDADKAWNGAINRQEYVLSLCRYVKGQEEDLSTKDRFAGLIMETDFYDDYMYTKIIKSLHKKLETTKKT